jgi:hypothetical protein
MQYPTPSSPSTRVSILINFNRINHIDVVLAWWAICAHIAVRHWRRQHTLYTTWYFTTVGMLVNRPQVFYLHGLLLPIIVHHCWRQQTLCSNYFVNVRLFLDGQHCTPLQNVTADDTANSVWTRYSRLFRHSGVVPLWELLTVPYFATEGLSYLDGQRLPISVYVIEQKVYSISPCQCTYVVPQSTSTPTPHPLTRILAICKLFICNFHATGGRGAQPSKKTYSYIRCLNIYSSQRLLTLPTPPSSSRGSVQKIYICKF